LHAYVYERRHCQVKVVGEISSICLDFIDDLIIFSRIAKINRRLDTTNIGERHFYPNVDRRLLDCLSSIQSSPSQFCLLLIESAYINALVNQVEIEFFTKNRTSWNADSFQTGLFTIELYEFAKTIFKNFSNVDVCLCT